MQALEMNASGAPQISASLNEKPVKKVQQRTENTA
jgi:hypothetical protein